MAGNIGTGSLTTITLTAENVNIDDAVIQDLIAKKITTLDLTSGSINTKDFTIQSDEGNTGLKIVNNTCRCMTTRAILVYSSAMVIMEAQLNPAR